MTRGQAGLSDRASPQAAFGSSSLEAGNRASGAKLLPQAQDQGAKPHCLPLNISSVYQTPFPLSVRGTVNSTHQVEEACGPSTLHNHTRTQVSVSLLCKRKAQRQNLSHLSHRATVWGSNCSRPAARKDRQAVHQQEGTPTRALNETQGQTGSGQRGSRETAGGPVFCRR